MRNLVLAGLLFAPLAGGGPANAACAEGRDCGTVIATGFGQSCVWVRVQSAVFNAQTTYGLPYGLPRTGVTAELIPDVAKIGRPISIKPGANFPCQLDAPGAASVVGMSNDPANQ